jgi:hypothetical protein
LREVPRPKSDKPLGKVTLSMPLEDIEVIKFLSREIGFGKLVLKSVLDRAFLRPWGPEVGLSEVAEKKAIKAWMDAKIGGEWNLQWYELWMSVLAGIAEKLDGDVGEIPQVQLESLLDQLNHIRERIEKRLQQQGGEKT